MVIYGAASKHFQLAGKSVTFARVHLQTPFNLPQEAQAALDGDPVMCEDDCLIPERDCVLEFVRQAGFKGLGELLSAQQLIERWKITPPQYQQLLQKGLPTEVFADGTARHWECAVDEWSRLRGCPQLSANLRRIADHFDPPPPDTVGSPYIASRLGFSTTWVGDLARRGEIPKDCIVPGTGNGKPWKFYRSRIDRWIESR